MKRSLMLVLVFLLLSPCFLSVTVPFAYAADYSKIGVRVGDTADYNVSHWWGTSIASTELDRMHVEQIAGTNVTLKFSRLYSNGSETPLNTITGNVSGTQILFNGIYLFLIAANLSEGDPIFPGTPESINQTTTMIVAGVNRTVNYNRATGGTQFYIYWDKETGLMVRSFLHIPYDGDITRELIATTAFRTETDYLVVTVVLIGGGAAVVFVVIIALVTERRKKS